MVIIVLIIMSQLHEKIFQALKILLNIEQNFIPLHEPSFDGKEWQYVKECLGTGWVSTAGKFVDEFELQLAQYTRSKYAIAVVNGTSALHICLKLAGVKPNDEVIIPALTFVATANAVSYCSAIPHFVDSEEKTLGLDPVKLEKYLEIIAEIDNNECFNKNTGRRIKAVVPVHTFGHPVDIDYIKEICNNFSVVLIEDAAESLGSFYKKRHTGLDGLMSALSFNGNKIISTGGGGAILTNDESLAKQARHLTTTAKIPHKWEYIHDELGYNYRMPNINAALGCAQLEQMTGILQCKRYLAKRYEKVFNEIQGVRFFTEPEFAKSNYWLNCILLDIPDLELRDKILKITNENGIMTRPTWTLLNQLPMYKDCPKMTLTTAEKLSARLINIPSSANL